MAKSPEAAADASVDTERAGLEDDAADQVGVDLARRLDRAAGRALDLSHDLARLVVGELVRGGELDLEAALLGGDEVCQHRAVVRFVLGRLADADGPDPEPEAPAPIPFPVAVKHPVCARCGRGPLVPLTDKPLPARPLCPACRTAEGPPTPAAQGIDPADLAALLAA